jgi:hypothetical protein
MHLVSVKLGKGIKVNLPLGGALEVHLIHVIVHDFV